MQNVILPMIYILRFIASVQELSGQPSFNEPFLSVTLEDMSIKK